MATIATIDMLLRAQTAQFSKDMKKARGDINGLKTSASGAMTSLKGMAAGYLSFQLVKSQVASTFKEMEEDAKATRKVEAALTATGHSARLSGEQLKAMATDFQNLSNFEDDAILNAEALLLTFRNIKGDNFKGATQAVLDMSAALDKDLQASVTLVGKSLNDPIKGLAALTKVGVSFSAEQKKMVKDMVAVNNIAGAQKLILDNLAKSYGGQALASTKTLTGEIQTLKEAWDELKISIAEPLTPGITAGIKDLTKALRGGDGAANDSTTKDIFGILTGSAIQDMPFRNAGLPGLRPPKLPSAASRPSAPAGIDTKADFGSVAKGFLDDIIKVGNAVRRIPEGFGMKSGQLVKALREGRLELQELTKAANLSLAAEIKAVRDSVRTPAEEFESTLTKLAGLANVGLGPENHLRALKQARKGLLDSARGDTPAALERGTAGAFSATRRGANDPLKNVDKNTATLITKADAQILKLEELIRQGRQQPKLAEAIF